MRRSDARSMAASTASLRVMAHPSRPAIWSAPGRYAVSGPSPSVRVHGYLGRGVPSSLTMVLVVLFMIACGGKTVASTDVPPAGQVWFGSAFDPATYAMTGRTETVGIATPVALVAHLTQAAGPGLTIRAFKEGAFVTSAPVQVTGAGDVVGLMLGALQVPGSWRYDLVDVGGNVLATGTVTAQ